MICGFHSFSNLVKKTNLSSPFYRCGSDVGWWSVCLNFTWLAAAELGLEPVSGIHTRLPSALHPKGRGLTNGACASSLLRRTHVPEGYTSFSCWEWFRQNRRPRSEPACWENSSWEACPLQTAFVQKSSGKCPQPHSLTVGSSHISHTHTDVTNRQDKGKAQGDREWYYRKKREATGILLSALKRLIVPSSP